MLIFEVSIPTVGTSRTVSASTRILQLVQCGDTPLFSVPEVKRCEIRR